MKRCKFICRMIMLMVLFLFTSIAINANYFSQIVLWLLFSYIISRELIDYFKETRDRRKCHKWPITFIIHNQKIKGDFMSFQLHTDEVLPFKLGKPIDSTGAEAPVEEGSLVIESSNPDVFTIEVDPDFPDDPYSGLIVAQAEGNADFKASADADLGDGVTNISLVINGDVLAAGATGFAPVQFGAPRKKTPPADSQQG